MISPRRSTHPLEYTVGVQEKETEQNRKRVYRKGRGRERNPCERGNAKMRRERNNELREKEVGKEQRANINSVPGSPSLYRTHSRASLLYFTHERFVTEESSNRLER